MEEANDEPDLLDVCEWLTPVVCLTGEFEAAEAATNWRMGGGRGCPVTSQHRPVEGTTKGAGDRDFKIIKDR